MNVKKIVENDWMVQIHFCDDHGTTIMVLQLDELNARLLVNGVGAYCRKRRKLLKEELASIRDKGKRTKLPDDPKQHNQQQ